MRFRLDVFAESIHAKGASLTNFWGFIDETFRPSCQPIESLDVMYGGHKRQHGLKFQAIMGADGL
jgi:hypothetical protein